MPGQLKSLNTELEAAGAALPGQQGPERQIRRGISHRGLGRRTGAAVAVATGRRLRAAAAAGAGSASAAACGAAEPPEQQVYEY